MSWRMRGPGAHSRRCPRLHLQHRCRLHLQRCPSRAPCTTSCSLSSACATSGSGRGGTITPGAHPEGSFSLSKANAVSCSPPQLAWDSFTLLPSLARPLTKMHPWPYGFKTCFQKGVVSRTAECRPSLRVPFPVPGTRLEWATSSRSFIPGHMEGLTFLWFLPSTIVGQASLP